MRGDHPTRGSSLSRRVLLVSAAVVGLLATAWVVAFVTAGPGIARGTTVLGVSIGGLSREEAARTLRRELRAESRAPITVRTGPERGRIVPHRAGLSLDVTATVETARARSWNPVELVDALVGGDEVAPVVAVDRAALRSAVGRLAAKVDREPVEGSVRIQGVRVRPVRPSVGLRVQQRAAVSAAADGYLVGEYLRGGPPLELPTEVAEPVVGLDEVDRVIAEVARPAVSAPVALTVEGTTVQVPPEAVGHGAVVRGRRAGIPHGAAGRPPPARCRRR